MAEKNYLTQFENIDTEAKAYWLGFLYADGYVSNKENKIELALAEKDYHHLEKFKSFMNIQNKICYKPAAKAYRISFRSDKCKEDLINKGCFPNKSLILKFPTIEQVPEDLLRHFVRGYFDGDGWFTNTDSLFQAGIIGTEEFIKGFLNTISIKSKNNKLFNVHREDWAKRYIFGALDDVYSFLSWMYDDSTVYLDRKYEHYIDFLTNGSQYHRTDSLKYKFCRSVQK